MRHTTTARRGFERRSEFFCIYLVLQYTKCFYEKQGGLIPELDTIVEEFTTASDKKKVVEKLKKEAKAAKDKAYAVLRC